jgi:hypothetical protein
MPDEAGSVADGSALPFLRDTNLRELLPAEFPDAPEPEEKGTELTPTAPRRAICEDFCGWDRRASLTRSSKRDTKENTV